MRVNRGLLAVLIMLTYPLLASAQSFQVQGSGGPTLTDPGNSVAAGIGYAPTSRLAFQANVERTHLESQIRRDARNFVSSAFRGGTLTLATVELQVNVRKRDRFGPYGLVGFAAGRSRPTVNEHFPEPVTNDVRAMFLGGGILIPVRDRLSLFADARMMVGAEGVEGIVGVAPLRAGVAWRF
jgi:hypothetical protein